MKIILENKEFYLGDYFDLENLFEVSSVHSQEKTSDLQKEIIKQINSEFINYISSFEQLLTLINLLDQKNVYLFLSVLGKDISKYIRTIDDISKILSYLADENNKLKTILFYGFKNLKSLIINAQDLGKILQWLYGYSELIFLTQLGDDFIKKIFSEHKEIYLILNFLSEDGRNYLLNLIGLELIISKIRNHVDLGTILRRLSTEQFITFLNLIGKEQLELLFKKEGTLEFFLLRLSDQKEKLFLSFYSS